MTLFSIVHFVFHQHVDDEKIPDLIPTRVKFRRRMMISWIVLCANSIYDPPTGARVRSSVGRRLLSLLRPNSPERFHQVLQYLGNDSGIEFEVCFSLNRGRY